MIFLSSGVRRLLVASLSEPKLSVISRRRDAGDAVLPPRRHRDPRSGFVAQYVSQYDGIVMLFVVRTIDERDHAGPGERADSV